MAQPGSAYDPSKRCKISLLSVHQKYICCDKNQKVNCNRLHCKNWETFTSIPVNLMNKKNVVYLQTHHKTYLFVDNKENIKATSNQFIATTFQFCKIGNKYGIMAQKNQKFISATSNGTIACDYARWIKNNEQFTINVIEYLNDVQLRKDDIIKKGKLQIKSGFSWNERYFILKVYDYIFEYYSDSNYTEFKNRIDLRKVFKVERYDDNYLYLHTKDKKWQLYSTNKLQLDEWNDLLSPVTQKRDTLSFTILNSNCVPSPVRDSGFVGDGLDITLNGSVNVESKLIFNSFVYPASKQSISIDTETKLDLIKNTNSFKVMLQAINKSYDIKVHKKSLHKNSVMSSKLKRRTDVSTNIQYNFDDEKRAYNQLYSNDIYVNIHLLCNYTINGEYKIDLIGSISKVLFVTRDNRKINANIKIMCEAQIKPTYEILRKNDPNTHNLWTIARNGLLSTEMENKIRLFIKTNKHSHINNGNGNQVGLLPKYMRAKLPFEECHLYKIPVEIINKKFLCHVEPFVINKYGEAMYKTIYWMGEITFNREEHTDREEYMDTLQIDFNGRIIHSYYKPYTLKQLFGRNHGTFNARMNVEGKNVVKKYYKLQFENKVKVIITSSDDPQVAKEATIYARIHEERYYYTLQDHYSEYNQSDQLPDKLPICVIL